MRKLTTIFPFIILLSLSSCSDFLSETPDNRTQIDSPEKISELLVNAYPLASYMEFTETMTDNVFDSGNLPSSTVQNTQSYNWEVPEDTQNDSPSFYWDACYTAIAHANQALDAISQLGDPKELNPQKGEALMARAYSHFMLTTLWSKHYNPATAATDLGIPYVLEPEDLLLKDYKRNTVAEDFALIEKDIEEGLKYVSNNYKNPKFHFTPNAAKAFASRFYLIKGNWDRVIALSESLGSKPTDLRDYQSYLNVDYTSGMIKYGSEGENTNLLIVSTASTTYRNLWRNRFAFTGADQAEILGSATNLFNKPWLYRPLSSNGGINQVIPKFYEYFKVTNANAGIGEPYNANVLISNDEFFLNRIEAHVMTNQLALALSELEYFTATRTKGYNPATDILTEAKIIAKYPKIDNEYTPFYTLTPLQASYIKAIAETRRRDFLHEGLRWIDIRRFNLEVTHQTYNMPDNILAKDDKRRELQIPSHAINRGIEKNPR
jgi:hypothetical protein